MNALGDTEADRLSRVHAEMARHRAACGCEVGSVFALAAVIGFLVYVGSGRGGDWSWAGTLARGLTFVVTVSIAGKLLGLAHARVRLVRLRAELGRLTAQTSAPLHQTRT